MAVTGDSSDISVNYTIGSQSTSTVQDAITNISTRISSLESAPSVQTIDPANFSASTYFFFNGRVLTNSTTYTVGANTNLCMMITLIQRTNNGTPEVFTFADVLHHT